MTAGRAFMSGIMMYIIVGGMVAVSNGVTQALTGRTLTGYLTSAWGQVWPMGE